MKKVLIILSLIVVMTINCTMANEYNLEKLGYTDMSTIITDIIYGVNNHDTARIEEHAMYISTEVYQSLRKDIEDDFLSGLIGTIALDIVDVTNSGTSDMVILANIKVWSDRQTYNNLYLYEFHVNKDGKIYGYNAWMY